MNKFKVISFLISRISECGVQQQESFYERRNVRLTNQISMVLAGSFLAVIIYRLLINEFNWYLSVSVFIQMVVYLIPIFLNFRGHVIASRILVCWLPAIGLIANAVFTFSTLGVHDSSTYTGFRFFLIAVSCFPLLVFNLSDKVLISVSQLATVLALIFYDPILNFFEIGYSQVGLRDSGYSFNTFRAFLSVGIVNLSVLFLKQIIEKNDRINLSLMEELKTKNKIILQRAAVEVTELDEKLYTNLNLLDARVKELTTLHQISQVLQDENRSLDDSMLEIVEIVRGGWQHPESIAVRMLIVGIEFKTPNFTPGPRSVQAKFILPASTTGLIEVIHMDDITEVHERSLLDEKQDVIETIAQMLGAFFAKRHESKALKMSEANLHAIINNTDTLIWSADRNMNLIAFNKPFYNHVNKYYGIELKKGTNSRVELAEKHSEMLAKWTHYYNQAFQGNKVTFEERRFEIDFYYSLNPIVDEDGRISGVNVFADDITSLKIKERELLEANKKIGELQLMALRSVMNPHFIFNALNSIQSFIVKNDRLNATLYLSKFSKLIRGILNHSVSNLVKLSEELELLNNYVQLEMVRFENKFQFSLEVDPEVDIDGIEIPSLLIQPYVENAILHGLCNKEKNGMLRITVSQNDEGVCFEIEDDGVGREAARQINSKKFAEHNSMGSRLTEERLKLINRHRKVSIQIEDLYDNGHPSGTRASFIVSTN